MTKDEIYKKIKKYSNMKVTIISILLLSVLGMIVFVIQYIIFQIPYLCNIGLILYGVMVLTEVWKHMIFKKV